MVNVRPAGRLKGQVSRLEYELLPPDAERLSLIGSKWTLTYGFVPQM